MIQSYPVFKDIYYTGDALWRTENTGAQMGEDYFLFVRRFFIKFWKAKKVQTKSPKAMDE